MIIERCIPLMETIVYMAEHAAAASALLDSQLACAIPLRSTPLKMKFAKTAEFLEFDDRRYALSALSQRRYGRVLKRVLDMDITLS